MARHGEWWAHNTDRSGPEADVPVVVEDNRGDFFADPDERARDWHPASDAEVARYEQYWNAEHDRSIHTAT